MRAYGIVILIAFAAFSFSALRAQTSSTFLTSGNYLVPSGVTSVTVQLWGTGGVFQSLNGAGGGGFVQSTAISVTPGTLIPVGVNLAEGNSTFGNILTAFGAVGKNGGVASVGSLVQFSFKGGNGGTGFNGSSDYGGGGGGAGGLNGPGRNGQDGKLGIAGNGGMGAQGGGNGGKGGSGSKGVVNTQSAAGGSPGGGKGGIGTNPSGGGKVIVTYNCTSANLPAVRGNAIVIADGDNTPELPNHTDFGSASYYNATIPRTFSIKNEGTISLRLNAISISGSHAASFIMQPITFPTLLAPGDSLTVNVVFDPNSTGLAQAIIKIITDHCPIPEYDFSIQGTGICLAGAIPEVRFKNVIVSNNDLTPSFSDSTNFGNVGYNGYSTQRTYTLQNQGTQVLRLDSLRISGVNATNFVFFPNFTMPKFLLPGEQVSVSVKFAPLSEGIKTATLGLYLENCPALLYNFTLQGTGICIPAANPILKGNSITIADGDATPSTADSTEFGNVGYNGFNTDHKYKIYNPGVLPLVLTAFAPAGNAQDFSITSLPALPFSILPGDSVGFGVRFSPVSGGVKTQTITISTDNCNISLLDFTVAGTGFCNPAGNPEVRGGTNVLIADGDITPNLADLTDFGDVATGGFSVQRNFIISNPSGAQVTVSNITLTGTNGNQFSVKNITFPATIAAKGSTSFSILFTPTTVGIKNTVVNITTNSCGLTLYDYALQGNGVPPSINTFNATGTFSPPKGISSIVVEAWGGGGNGSYPDGGGGGAYVLSKPLGVTHSTSYPVTVVRQDFSSFSNLIIANSGFASRGGAASSGPNVVLSYSGGGGGAGVTVNTHWLGGGGGGAAGRTSNGGNGGDANISYVLGVGGIAGTGGGNGGLGGATFGNGGDFGQAPGGGGGGVSNLGNGNGSSGRIIVSYNCPRAGTIGNSHSIPFPPQLVPDSIFNIEGETPTAQNGLEYTWEKSVDQNNWTIINVPKISLSYRFDSDSLKQTTWYRRSTNSCIAVKTSNIVKITVINPANGVVKGTVRSKNGQPVNGIKIYVQKQSSLPGSPISWIDSAVTGIDGKYTISGIYYGDKDEAPNNGSNVKTIFNVRPVKAGHGFIPALLPKELSTFVSQVEDVDFTDTTVYAVSGKVYQECVGCLNSNDVPATITSPVDSVDIFKDNSFNTKTGFINKPAPGAFGRYSVTVSDPQTYKIEPRFRNHKFEPVFKNVLVNDNVNNVDFKDTTFFTISGRLTAGCHDYIGTAELEFYDLVPNDANGNPRSPEFRKRVITIPGSGFYSIKLPARKYAVRVINFYPAEGIIAPFRVESNDLLDFFNTRVPTDSLKRDITTHDTTLNLVYNRPPELDIVGLPKPVCVPPVTFSLIQQSKETVFTIRAFQGPVSKNCPVVDTTLIINTNIQKEDDNEEIIKKTIGGLVAIKLTGGLPNIVAPHLKVLNILFRDVYGRQTELNPAVVVTGLKSNIGTFATVSPEVPIMILHDPPGDNSYSFWETTKSVETAMRMYAAKASETTSWSEVKLGVKYEAGLGVTTESRFWGSVKGSVTVGSRINNATEAILSTSTTNTFSTASNDAVVGAQGDVFIGAALNLLYAVTNELKYDFDSCTLSLNKKLMVSNNGFATQYIYSEDHIRNTLLPALRTFRDNPANTAEQTRNYINQIKVWEQTLANNEKNKLRAPFDKNISFDGSAGAITSSTTSTSTKAGTIEFDLSLDATIAGELGFEIGGSGASSGVFVGFKMETGISITNTNMNATTIGYTLDDDDNGDFFSVNIKKDPVYNTPVFEMVAGTTSCPYEPGSQPRDEMQFVVPQPVKIGIAPEGEAEFILKISNTSQSGERRSYNLSFIQASNPNGAVVTIGGSPAVNPISYSIDYFGELNVLVKVKRGASNIFSYEGLQFRLTDACDGSIVKTTRISAFFDATCSPIELVNPEEGWISNAAENSLLPILFKGYTIAGTTSVTLEYQRSGANNWITGFTRTAAELNNSSNGTQVNWNIASLIDGVYNLRMRLNCPNGVVTSTRSTGVIDRQAPLPVGKPEPTDDEFVRGDLIAINYNERLDCDGVTPSDVEVRKLSTGALLPVNVGCFQNRIVVMPLTDIAGLVGDSIRVSVKNISDVNGNGKTTSDSWRFIIGNTIAATGPRALSLSAAPPPGGIPGKTLLSGVSVLEDDGQPIKFVFQLGANAANDMLINYTVTGNAVFGKDYNIDYNQPQNLATVFNGATGSLTLKKSSSKIELSIIPLPNQQFEPDKTIIITLAEGGDYELGANTNATGTILNDDSPKIFIFTGNGNYNVPANWDNGIVPPAKILIGDEVIIDPPLNGECILNIPVTVLPGATFKVMPGKVLKINNNLQLKKKL